MGEETSKKRQYLYGLILFSILFSVLIFNVSQHKRICQPVVIKRILSKKNRPTPKLWKELLGHGRRIAENDPRQISMPVSRVETIKTLSDTPIAEQSTETLANYLNSYMRKIDSQDLVSLQKNIAVADEIILRAPESYSGHKAKLIMLLVQEAKFKQKIEDYDVNSLLSSMADFDVSHNTQAIKEAILISNANNEIQKLDDDLTDIYGEKEDLEMQLSSMDLEQLSSATAQFLKNRLAYLSVEEQRLFERIIILERNIEEGELLPANALNEDLIHIPFLRMLARSDFDEVISNAENFIDQFPDSPIGYFYLVKTLRILDREDEALTLILNSGLSKEALSAIQMNLERFENVDPRAYWKMLKF